MSWFQPIINIKLTDDDGHTVVDEVTLLCCCFSSLSLASSSSCWIFWTCLFIFRMVECRISQMKSLDEEKRFQFYRARKREAFQTWCRKQSINITSHLVNSWAMSWEKSQLATAAQSTICVRIILSTNTAIICQAAKTPNVQVWTLCRSDLKVFCLFVVGTCGWFLHTS